MSESVAVVWDERFLGYNFGREHPMHPVRVELTMRLAAETGVLQTPGLRVIGAEQASDELLELIHDPAYISVVKQAPEDPFGGLARRYGLHTDDNPVFWDMHAAASLVVGGTVGAAREVWSGSAQHAVSIAGGLHHAMRARASGFCVYNDVAVAIAWLLEQGARRVAYIDVDVHHGDGVQTAFYSDPRVLTISLHESGFALFPGTGFPEEVGSGEAEGTAVNVALPSWTGDEGWLRAYSGVVPVLIRAFEPDVLVTQCGCDTHRDDPLASLTLSIEGQRESYRMLHDLAHEVCDGRWLATGGGGYGIVDVVPRAWTHLIAQAAAGPLDPGMEVPVAWHEFAQERTGSRGRPFMGDGVPLAYRPWDAGDGDADDPVDRAIAATRHAVLPLHGLDPLRDR